MSDPRRTTIISWSSNELRIHYLDEQKEHHLFHKYAELTQKDDPIQSILISNGFAWLAVSTHTSCKVLIYKGGGYS